MTSFSEATRPVLFECENSEYPYFGIGSSTFFSTNNNYYWVTAKHVITEQNQSPTDLRIFPTDGSRMSIPFSTLVEVDEDPEDTDYSDLYVLQIHREEFENNGDGILTAQRVEDGILDANHLNANDDLVVVGFPEQGRAIDYEEYKIKYERAALKATYSGHASMKYCHKLQFHESHNQNTFNALSGSSVYKMVNNGNHVFPKVVGILLRGTASSGIGYFVNAEVLRNAIYKAEH